MRQTEQRKSLRDEKEIKKGREIKPSVFELGVQVVELEVAFRCSHPTID